MLIKKLLFFIADQEMTHLIASCLQTDPIQRPDLRSIQITLKDYKSKIGVTAAAVNCKSEVPPVDVARLRKIISEGITGLMEDPIPMQEGLWLSRTSKRGDLPGKQKNEFGKSVGLYDGLTGVLYFLSRAKEAGFNISSCLPSYEKGYAYLQQLCFDCISETPPGLYGGAAGIALALANGIRAGLLADTPERRSSLLQYLSLPNENPILQAGLAGQGIATLQCSAYLEKEAFERLLQSQVRHLLDNQHHNRYWAFHKDRLGRSTNAISFSYGNTGIIWFLMAYNEMTHDSIVAKVVQRALQSLENEARKLIRQTNQRGVRSLLIGNDKIGDGLQGLALVFTKAYEILRDPVYKQLVVDLLELYPLNLVHDNIFQDTGLSGIGELHLEAYRVFQLPVFKVKSDNFINYFLHTYHKGENDTCHWIGNNAEFPTADLMTGNAGILHFLLRGLPDSSTGYRLLG